jgi:hypothetical protein
VKTTVPKLGHGISDAADSPPPKMTLGATRQAVISVLHIPAGVRFQQDIITLTDATLTNVMRQVSRCLISILMLELEICRDQGFTLELSNSVDVDGLEILFRCGLNRRHPSIFSDWQRYKDNVDRERLEIIRNHQQARSKCLEMELQC